MSRIRSSAACLTVALLLCGSGCATPKWLNFSKTDLSVAGPDNPVVHILPLWQPATGTGIDKEPARGFAGQIYFFAGKDRVPAQVHGTVRVYEFDDQGSDQDRIKPIHQFDFPDTAWQMYLADTKLGPCYTLFIPYVRKGFHQAQCTLRVRLTPDDGPPIYSDMISIALPGTGDGESKAAAATPPQTAAATPRQAPAASAAAATRAAAPNPVQQAAAIVAESANQQPRRLPQEEQQQMVRQMAQYLQTTAADEEEAPAAPPKRMKKKRPAKPVAEEEEYDDVEVVEYADDEPPARSRSRRAAPRRQHPLDEDEAPRARPARRVSSSHPLAMDEEEAGEEVPRQAPRGGVRVESAQATPVNRGARRSSGRVDRAAARFAEPESDDDDVEVIEAGEEVEDEAPRKSQAAAGWQSSTQRRAPRQVIQQASAEVEVEIAPQSDAVNASTAVRPKMQTFSIPLSPQSRAFVAH